MSRKLDAIIIGTGQAGPSLAGRLSSAGITVAIIQRHKFGGTCVNTGCIPTKTLVASAYAAHVARRGADYGFAIAGNVHVDMKRVKARKDEVSGRSNRAVEQWLRGLTQCTVIQGHARFDSSRTVRVNDELLEANKVFINVGGRASVPPMPGLSEVPFLTNSSIMDVDFVPEHLIIVGGSYVGLEFAQMYRRFGNTQKLRSHGRAHPYSRSPKYSIYSFSGPPKLANELGVAKKVRIPARWVWPRVAAALESRRNHTLI